MEGNLLPWYPRKQRGSSLKLHNPGDCEAGAEKTSPEYMDHPVHHHPPWKDWRVSVEGGDTQKGGHCQISSCVKSVFIFDDRRKADLYKGR